MNIVTTPYTITSEYTSPTLVSGTVTKCTFTTTKVLSTTNICHLCSNQISTTIFQETVGSTSQTNQYESSTTGKATSFTSTLESSTFITSEVSSSRNSNTYSTVSTEVKEKQSSSSLYSQNYNVTSTKSTMTDSSRLEEMTSKSISTIMTTTDESTHSYNTITSKNMFTSTSSFQISESLTSSILFKSSSNPGVTSNEITVSFTTDDRLNTTLDNCSCITITDVSTCSSAVTLTSLSLSRSGSHLQTYTVYSTSSVNDIKNYTSVISAYSSTYNTYSPGCTSCSVIVVENFVPVKVFKTVTTVLSSSGNYLPCTLTYTTFSFQNTMYTNTPTKEYKKTRSLGVATTANYATDTLNQSNAPESVFSLSEFSTSQDKVTQLDIPSTSISIQESKNAVIILTSTITKETAEISDSGTTQTIDSANVSSLSNNDTAITQTVIIYTKIRPSICSTCTSSSTLTEFSNTISILPTTPNIIAQSGSVFPEVQSGMACGGGGGG